MRPFYTPSTTPQAIRQSNGRGERGNCHRIVGILNNSQRRIQRRIAEEFWLHRPGDIPLLGQSPICNKIPGCSGTDYPIWSESAQGGVDIVYSSRFSRHRIWALAPHPRRHCSKCRTYLAREPEYERLKCRIDSRVTRGTAPVAMYCSLRREIAAVTEVHKIISSLARPADLSM